ncbi:hypothetical protein [Streptomyces sp. NPDC004296]|uniref:hypothetical protein n=1 Tax=Streptomyces sp. NPDC004296 TaxID=3364697 RepID=UPI0036839DC2
MADSEIAERIAARRAELGLLEAELDKQLAELRAERDELAVAERVWHRMAGQSSGERPRDGGPASAQVAGRAVLLVPHREGGMAETALPPENQRILAAVRATGSPTTARAVAGTLDPASATGSVEALRGKLTRLADRGWLRKLPDGRFAARP